MNWDGNEIQSRYFRVGPGTHLWLDYDEKAETLLWCFTFLDLGMCHTLTGTATLTFPTLPDMMHYTVNGQTELDSDSAMQRVFAKHYQNFLTRLYIDLGVQVEND